MGITSPAFSEGGVIPAKYTCDGENVNPALSISGVPAEAKSLVLIMDDPDIPDFVRERLGADTFDHWVVFNLPPSITELPEGQSTLGVLGKNSAGSLGYTGPCPPDREHRYFFKLYALDTELDLPAGATKEEVEKAMKGHILAKAQLMGKYKRVK